MYSSRLFLLTLVFGLCSVIVGCYSFRGFSISPDTRTYTTTYFTLSPTASLATPDMGELFSELLKEKVRQETRLIFQEELADVSFEGEIKSYNIASVGPQGATDQDQLMVGSELSRLEVTIHVIYENKISPQYSFKKDFRHFADFDRDQDLIQVRDNLLDQIYERILEDVFNEAFSNW